MLIFHDGEIVVPGIFHDGDIVVPEILNDGGIVVPEILNDDEFFIVRERTDTRNINIFFTICTEQIIANTIHFLINRIVKFGFHFQKLPIVQNAFKNALLDSLTIIKKDFHTAVTNFIRDDVKGNDV